MRLPWSSGRTSEPQDRSGGTDAARAGKWRRPGAWPYSSQYQAIVAQGHERPTPAFGAPTLVWHVGLWPRRIADTGQSADPHDTAGSQHGRAKADFEARRLAWVDQIRDFVARLQRAGCHPLEAHARDGAKTLALVKPHDLDWQPQAGEDDFFRPVHILEPGTAPFTLWWPDKSEPSEARARANAIRICVHPEVNADYACLSFYMDLGQAWNAAHDAEPGTSRGSRRSKLLAAVNDIRAICEHQLAPAPSDGRVPVDRPTVPEALSSPDGRDAETLHQALLDARNLLYVDIWEMFAAEMVCGLSDLAGARGEVFANFRGLIMATAGTRHQTAVDEPHPREVASAGTHTFPAFSRDPSFAADGAEANAVVKAFWPFVRRVTPLADYREFVACGVLNFRAIYITALGSSSQYVEGQERPRTQSEGGEASIRVPDALLSPNDKGRALASEAGHFDSLVQKREVRDGNNHPVRYLLLTKGEPHPRQIGRVAERINTMGTMRLYALKDWSAIRNADAYIRILGQELDQLTKNWGASRRLVNELTTLRKIRVFRSEVERLKREGSSFIADPGTTGWTAESLALFQGAFRSYTPKRAVNRLVWIILRLRFIHRPALFHELMGGMENDAAADIRHSVLYEVSNKVETNLIDISAKLDELGFGTVGGLHFRLNRSTYYVREFKVLLRTLQVGNIPSWVSYEQFVRRGLMPAFDYAASIGKRLRAVRTRLLTTTEMIETSALVGQSAATRHNTAVLRNTTRLAIIFLVLYLVRGPILKGLAWVWGKLLTVLPAGLLPFAQELAEWFK